jgi:hypothetical protein
MSTPSALFCIATPALLFASLGFSQVVGGALSGTIRDQAGYSIPGVAVTVHNLETGADRKLITDATGHYAAPSIAVGPYSITAAKESFASVTRTGINLVVGQTAAIDFALNVGEVRQVVTVQETLPPVSLSTQQTSGLITERQVKELPLNGRSFDGLMTLNPAVVNYTAQRSGGVGTSNSSVGNMFAVSGHRPQENLFLLNGIEYTGASNINNTPGGTSGQLLGVDAVREFNVVTDTYGAEYGKRPGAQVSIITASGTNDLHGSIYEFMRNSDLDARNFFDQKSTPHFQRNVFGASLGGPIKKNKFFVFGNYEGFRQHLALSNVTLVPDNNARLGLLPNSSGSLTKVTKISPAAVDLLSLWPLQNGSDLGGGIGISYNNPLQRIREDFGTTRVDYNFSDRDTFFGVYTIDDSAANTPSVNPLSTVFETLREQVASVQEQHVFSPTLLNTARFGFSRAGYFFTGQTAGGLPGWVEGDPIGAVVIGGGTALNGASQLSGAGANAGSNISAVRNLFTYDDHIAFTRGIHQIEAGVWVQRIQANDNLAQDQYGQASFGSLTAFLQGTVSTFAVVPSPTPLGWRSLATAGFAQDSIRVTSRLHLEAGFRAEGTNGWNESHNRASTYLFTNGLIETNPQVGRSVFTVNRAKFLPEPRFGMAWDPTGRSKTVIHAGFGIYRALLDNIDYRVDAAAPFNTTDTVKNAALSSILFVPDEPVKAGSKISPSGIQPDAYTPTILSWTFKVEQQIAPDTSLSVGYVGSHGYHEMLSLDANEPFPSYTASGQIYYPTGVANANPALANSTHWFSEGVSSYNSLQVDVNRHFSHGLQIRGVYTWSKSLDDGTAWNSSVASNAPGFVMFPLNPKLDYGPSTTDVSNLAVLNGTYELPFGTGRHFASSVTGWQQKLIGGWSTSAIVTLQSGLPFTPQLGYNLTNNGDSRNPIRPSVNPDFSGSVILGTPNQYFNPNAFINPAAGTYGNLGRDTLAGPGLRTVDFSATKRTVLTERMSLQFRAELFNIFNNVNFSAPNAVVFTSATTTPASTAGVITATSSTSRQIQFGLKLLF